jgi:hypothetical protein
MERSQGRGALEPLFHMPNLNTQLSLYEEYLLLALRDDTGASVAGVSLGLGLGSALLADLMLSGKVDLEKEGKRSFLKLVDHTSTGDALLDECLTKVQSAKRRAQLSTWVQRFSALKQLKQRAAEKLCDRGILKHEEATVLWVFKRQLFPEIDGRAEKEILGRLRSAIFTQTREMEPRTVVLVSLANATGLLRASFDKKKLKERKKRIAQITEGEFLGQAAAEAVQAAVAAAAMAAIMPAMMATVVVTS